ncbi:MULTISPECIES: hypothetical protein [Bacillus cereus group]|uniref:Uncharacterized protein n=1 Tax=Bacillus thuringiensis TaxID=1428 RepID=A0AB36V8D4_BACTU|nr:MULTISPECIES: hypothetical protein [Bacillus cereus group]EJS45009.1 hypothetical protein ICE_05799 [Bacillus cereus BAG1X1-2]MED3621789.1 hypothetical protein [Bacillus thuringiensis]PER43276.1 hypothetical protein CN472_25160 [Bacillus thuringiensis]PGO58964.1 hypothetical protein CN986_01660 [Bacillus thuringiensis]PGW89956.1 hypothetical protein COE32_24520 [Bacillus cereus]
MNVYFKNDFGDKVFATVNKDIAGLIAALQVSSVVKLNNVNHKVTDYQFEYIQYASHEEPELTVIVERIYD